MTIYGDGPHKGIPLEEGLRLAHVRVFRVVTLIFPTRVFHSKRD